jgi:carboxylesterase type B
MDLTSAEMWGQAGDKFDEDCLTLNVWSKPQSGEKAKAVMVWIYGGGETQMFVQEQHLTSSKATQLEILQTRHIMEHV